MVGLLFLSSFPDSMLPISPRVSLLALVMQDGAGRPLNPRGRTGFQGRGAFTRWGPNHTKHYVITRTARRSNGEAVTKHGKAVLQVLLAYDADVDQTTLPGGPVAEGSFTDTLAGLAAGYVAELNTATPGLRDSLSRELQDLFATQAPTQLFAGLVDDDRNTDSAWCV